MRKQNYYALFMVLHRDTGIDADFFSEAGD